MQNKIWKSRQFIPLVLWPPPLDRQRIEFHGNLSILQDCRQLPMQGIFWTLYNIPQLSYNQIITISDPAVATWGEANII